VRFRLCLFAALKSLSLKGYSQNREIVRELLLTRFELDQMSLVHLVLSFHSLEMWRPFRDGFVNEEQMEFPAEPEIFRIDEYFIHARIEELQYNEELFAKGVQRTNCPIHHVAHSCVRHNLLDVVKEEFFNYIHLKYLILKSMNYNWNFLCCCRLMGKY